MYQYAFDQPARQSDDIELTLGRLADAHYAALDAQNDALLAGQPVTQPPTTHVNKLRAFWGHMFPGRSLGGSPTNPTVSCGSDRYGFDQMSDGERGALYLSARVLRAPAGHFVVDEPELFFHGALAKRFWTQMEDTRPDLRFIYATHDLSFALSRRNGLMFRVTGGRKSPTAQRIAPAELGDSLVLELLGAATLTRDTRRVVFFEGTDEGFASDFFHCWFSDIHTTSVLGIGNREDVCRATIGMGAGNFIAGLEVVGIIDRDFYSDNRLNAEAGVGLAVLGLHEVESLLVLPGLVQQIAQHLGKAYDDSELFDAANTSAARVAGLRARMAVEGVHHAWSAKLLDGSAAQVKQAHLDLMRSARSDVIFEEAFDREFTAVQHAIRSRDCLSILRMLEGKPLLAIVAQKLGVKVRHYTDLVLGILRGEHGAEKRAVVEHELSAHLPSREG